MWLRLVKVLAQASGVTAVLTEMVWRFPSFLPGSILMISLAGKSSRGKTINRVGHCVESLSCAKVKNKKKGYTKKKNEMRLNGLLCWTGPPAAVGLYHLTVLQATTYLLSQNNKQELFPFFFLLLLPLLSFFLSTFFLSFCSPCSKKPPNMSILHKYSVSPW